MTRDELQALRNYSKAIRDEAYELINKAHVIKNNSKAIRDKAQVPKNKSQIHNKFTDRMRSMIDSLL